MDKNSASRDCVHRTDTYVISLLREDGTRNELTQQVEFQSSLIQAMLEFTKQIADLFRHDLERGTLQMTREGRVIAQYMHF